MGVSPWPGAGKADPDFALSSRVWGGEGRTGGGKWGLLMMLGRGRKENAIDPHGPKTLNGAESSKFSTLLFQGQWREKLCSQKKPTSKDIEGKTSVHRKLLNAYNFGPKRATAVEGRNLVF